MKAGTISSVDKEQGSNVSFEKDKINSSLVVNLSNTTDDYLMPPDGGWGWAVVLSSFLIHLIADGIVYSFGVFLMEFVVYFKAGRGAASWIGAMQPAVTFTVGPLASMLTNRYGCRKVTIAGAVIAASGFVFSVWAPNIYCLYFTSGFMAGVGFGLIYLPAIVCVSQYFEKRRSFAIGLAVCGSGFGTFIIAPFTVFLLQKFSWQGTMLILGGIILNIIICGLIFRPLNADVIPPRKFSRTPEADALSTDADLEELFSLRDINMSTMEKTEECLDKKPVNVGPIYKGMEINDKKVVLSASHTRTANNQQTGALLCKRKGVMDANNCSNSSNQPTDPASNSNAGKEYPGNTEEQTSYHSNDSHDHVSQPEKAQTAMSDLEDSQRLLTVAQCSRDFISEPLISHRPFSEPQENQGFLYGPHDPQPPLSEPQDSQGFLCKLQDSHGFLYEPQTSQGFLSVPQISQGFLSAPQVSQGFLSVPQASQRLSVTQVNQGFLYKSHDRQRPRSVPQISQGFLSMPQASQCFPSVPQISQDDVSIPHASQGFPPIPQVSQGFPPIAQVSQGFPLIPQVSQGFLSILHDHQRPLFKPHDSKHSVHEPHDCQRSLSLPENLYEPRYSQFLVLEPRHSQLFRSKAIRAQLPVSILKYTSPPMSAPRDSEFLTSDRQDSECPTSEPQDSECLIPEPQDSKRSISELKDIQCLIFEPQYSEHPKSNPPDIECPRSHHEDNENPLQQPQDSERPIYKPHDSQRPITKSKYVQVPTFEKEHTPLAISEEKYTQFPISEPNYIKSSVSEPKYIQIPIFEDKCSQFPLSEAKFSQFPLSEDKISQFPLSEEKCSQFPTSEEKCTQVPTSRVKHSQYPDLKSQFSQTPASAPEGGPHPLPKSQDADKLVFEPRLNLLSNARSDSDIRELPTSVIAPKCFAASPLPLKRKDIFYSSSLQNIPMYRSQPDLYRIIITVAPDRESLTISERTDLKRGLTQEFRMTMADMLSLTLLRNPVFLMFAVSNFFTSLGFNMPFIFLPDRAILAGIDEQRAALLLSVIGIANTAGRILFGYLSDRPFVNRLMLYSTALTICGLVTALSTLIGSDYRLFVTYAAVFGVFIGVYVSLTSVVLVDLLGLEYLTNSFGLLLLFQGAATFVGPPIAGWLCDWTGSYDISFLLMGSLVAVSGLMLYFLPMVERYYALGATKVYTVRDLELGKKPVTEEDIEIISLGQISSCAYGCHESSACDPVWMSRSCGGKRKK